MHIHFIGICGVAMSALAIALHKKGHTITGSDKGFYPPVSTHLKNAGVNYYPGWHPQKMVANGNPDLVVVGNVAGSKNPEWLYVQKHHLPYCSYPELLQKEFIQETSIVCAGTYGKSTSTTLLSWILQQSGKDPSYMFGGVSRDGRASAHIGKDPISVVEGDEYKSARWDNGAKFFHYSPTHLLLTSVVWDHADVYPTEKLYIDAFLKLVQELPKSGVLVASAKVQHEQPKILQTSKATVVTYGKTADNDYQYSNVLSTINGVEFDITFSEQTVHIKSAELGDYMPDNMTGCFAMAHQMGIEVKKIIEGIESFQNIKRRLEKRHDDDIVIFDDIAHSPKKAEAVLRTLKEFTQGKLICVFEPNNGNRQQESIPGYAHKFDFADEVIIPRLSRIKRDPNQLLSPLDERSLTETISQTHNHVHCIDEDESLIEYLETHTKKGDIIAFLGSHSFRGMIDQLAKKFSAQHKQA